MKKKIEITVGGGSNTSKVAMKKFLCHPMYWFYKHILKYLF